MNDVIDGLLNMIGPRESFVGFHPADNDDDLFIEETTDIQDEPQINADEIINELEGRNAYQEPNFVEDEVEEANYEVHMDPAINQEEVQEISDAQLMEAAEQAFNDTEEQERQQAEQEQTMQVLAKNMDVLIHDETLRFSSAEWFAKTQEQSIILAGVGGIGSWISFLLAKLKPAAIYMYDPDTVELVNMAGQLYSLGDIGRPKVDALANTIREYTGYGNIFCYNQRYNEQCATGNIMICGFDNMEARRVFFNNWAAHVGLLNEEERKKCLFIDGRLTAEELQILCIQGDDTYSMTQYMNRFLFNDEEAEHEVCSFKQTAFMANMIGALVVNLVVNFCANLCNPDIPRTLPFFTHYQANMMFFNIEQ